MSWIDHNSHLRDIEIRRFMNILLMELGYEAKDNRSLRDRSVILHHIAMNATTEAVLCFTALCQLLLSASRTTEWWIGRVCPCFVLIYVYSKNWGRSRKVCQDSRKSNCVAGWDLSIAMLLDVMCGSLCQDSRKSNYVAGWDLSIAMLSDVMCGSFCQDSRKSNYVAGWDLSIAMLLDIMCGS
jgi:hypothetical protein